VAGLLLLQLMHNFLFIYYHLIFEALHAPGQERERERECTIYNFTRYAEEVRRKAGDDDLDWREAPFDPDAAYVAGGGLPHGRLGIGDGVVSRDSFGRRSVSSVGSRSRTSTSRESELDEQLRQQQQQVQQLSQQVQMMQGMLMQMYSAQMGSPMGPQFTRPSQSGQTPNTNETQGSETGQGNPQMDIQWSMPPRGQILPPPQPGMGYWPPPPWGYPTHPMGPWGRPPWPTQPLPSPA
ncbi:hypothetical protein ACJX0J_042264, partial [Zea mays]